MIAFMKSLWRDKRGNALVIATAALPLVLGSAELRALRDVADTAVYTSAKREVSRRTDELGGAIELVDAIVTARQAA